MQNENILTRAREYTITCMREMGTNIDGFPLKPDQMEGLLHIINAHKVIVKIAGDNIILNDENFMADVVSDVNYFLDNPEIPLSYNFIKNMVMEYVVIKSSSIYIIKNYINIAEGVNDAVRTFRFLVNGNHWDRIWELIGDRELCQEI